MAKVNEILGAQLVAKGIRAAINDPSGLGHNKANYQYCKKIEEP